MAETDTLAPAFIGVEVYDPIVILRPEMVRIGEGSRIDSFVKIEGGEGVQIGRCVHVASFAHLNVGGGRLRIGDYVAITTGVKLISGSNTPQGRAMNTLAPPEWYHVRRLHIIIHDFAFIGANAVVLPGVIIGKGSMLGAGSVLRRDIPDWEFWAGVPARLVRKREPKV